MSWGWGDDTVTRIRPQLVEDAHGDERPDWTGADQVQITGIAFAPKDDGDGGTIYAPRQVDITAGDHIVWRQRRFEVMGVPQQWRPGTVVIVEGVDIPGQ